MYRTFLCCLPVRLGTFVLSALQCMLSVAVAGVLWFVLIKDGEYDVWFLGPILIVTFPSEVHVDTAQKIAVYATAVIWSLLAIFSFFG